MPSAKFVVKTNYSQGQTYGDTMNVTDCSTLLTVTLTL